MFSLYATSSDSDASGDHDPVYIKKNDAILCEINITSGNANPDERGADTNSCSAVAEVAPEDSVRVTGSADNPAFIQGARSGFIGHMIRPYC